VTAQNSFETQKRAFQNTIPVNRLGGINRAGRVKTAIISQKRREKKLVSFNKKKS